jgi:hypothetical protein
MIMSTKPGMESPISFRVSAKWLEALDNWRDEQAVKPSRTAVIMTAVELFIARDKRGSETRTDISQTNIRDEP